MQKIPINPDTLATRSNLALAYWEAGRNDDAIELTQQVLTDSERILGPDHRVTLNTRSNLAITYAAAGRADDAIEVNERALTDSERILGERIEAGVTRSGERIDRAYSDFSKSRVGGSEAFVGVETVEVINSMRSAIRASASNPQRRAVEAALAESEPALARLIDVARSGGALLESDREAFTNVLASMSAAVRGAGAPASEARAMDAAIGAFRDRFGP